MPDKEKRKINIALLDLKNIVPMFIDPDKEYIYRKAESYVNGLWTSWSEKFKGTLTSEELVARIAFQFARLYVEASLSNDEVKTYLNEFEKTLDDMVIKLKNSE
ncbi:MAG: cell division protein ZapA [Muribaculaceae bacterium]